MKILKKKPSDWTWKRDQRFQFVWSRESYCNWIHSSNFLEYSNTDPLDLLLLTYLLYHFFSLSLLNSLLFPNLHFLQLLFNQFLSHVSFWSVPIETSRNLLNHQTHIFVMMMRMGQDVFRGTEKGSWKQESQCNCLVPLPLILSHSFSLSLSLSSSLSSFSICLPNSWLPHSIFRLPPS